MTKFILIVGIIALAIAIGLTIEPRQAVIAPPQTTTPNTDKLAVIAEQIPATSTQNPPAALPPDPLPEPPPETKIPPAATTASLIAPEEILQGNVARITTESAPFLTKVVFDGAEIKTFVYAGKPRAFIAIDLAKKPGTYTLKATLTDNTLLTKKIEVIGRAKPQVESVDIPEKLGGNTSSSQNDLLASIAAADTDIKKVRTADTITWTQAFIPPLAEMFVTNPYGYGVDTGAYTLPHKGVDLKAAVGTNVPAMNRGVVKVAKEYRSYGKMVLIDHGLGIQTLYLHLSKMNVKVGDVVPRGKIIGLSGDTGYVSGPHLHLSVRVGGTSIDPMQFLKLFNP